jgi:hypothetical protein
MNLLVSIIGDDSGFYEARTCLEMSCLDVWTNFEFGPIGPSLGPLDRIWAHWAELGSGSLNLGLQDLIQSTG